MSVEYCLIRVSPPLFADLRRDPNVLHELMDGFYGLSSDERPAKGYIDSRDAYSEPHMIAPPMVRLFYADEFTTSLLVDFMDERSAFFEALVGWGAAHILSGVSYGYGEIAYYLPADAKKVALNLQGHPHALLEARFSAHADQFRLAAAGYLDTDQAILAHQQRFADLLRRFYAEAIRDGDVVLLLMV